MSLLKRIEQGQGGNSSGQSSDNQGQKALAFLPYKPAGSMRP